MNAACTFSHRVDPRVLSHGPPFPYKALQGLHSALLVARIMHASYCTHIHTDHTSARRGRVEEEGTQKRGLRGGERREEVREGDPGVNRETYPELPQPPVLTKGRHHH